MPTLGYDLNSACLNALESCRRWMGGAVIIRLDDGSYDACPPAHLTDISFSLRANIHAELFSVNDLFDILGPDTAYPSDVTYSELHPNDQEWTLNQVIAAVQEADAEPPE